MPPGSATAIEFRELTNPDVPFLRKMLYTALFWRPGRLRPPAFLILRHPQAALYHRNWGRPGDFGLVAEVDGQRVGAAWWRFFTETEHGHGYVDEQTPELAIALLPPFRRRGIGRRLLEAMHEHGREAGIEQVSLSVEDDNPAKALYRSLGYVDHEPGDGKGRMVLTLRSRW
jgi:ribosomal protein S18 acetylase RimI-like enzyme